MIYLDNGATTIKKPETVYQAADYALRNLGNPSRGAYTASVKASKAVYSAREKVAALFNAGSPHRVAFTSNITEALNICAKILLKEGDRVITTYMEHNSVLRPLYKSGAAVEITSPSPRDIERELKQGARAVFISHASNLTGDLCSLEEIGALTKKYGAYLVIDSAQTAGVFPLDMKKASIDCLCFAGHKSLLGPQGVGGLCLSERVEAVPQKVGGSGFASFNREHPAKMPEVLEAGTLNTPAIHALSAGIDFINETGIDNIRSHEEKLHDRLYSGIKDLEKIKIYGSFKEKKAPLIAFNIADIDSGLVAEELWSRFEVAVRSGAHCAPLYHKHLGTERQGAVRMSISYFNTLEEIDKVVSILRQLHSEI